MMLLVLIPASFAAEPAPVPPTAPALTVALDTRETPELKEWAAKAKVICEEQYPKICEILEPGVAIAPKETTLLFKKEMEGIAFASGSKITISGPYLAKRPDDFGMVVHELTHVIQAYPRSDAGWLVEGIADYVRYHKYEPKNQPRIDFRTATYRDGYGTTAAFLAWSAEKYDKDLVCKLHASLKAGKYAEGVWVQSTRKTPGELWKEFQAAKTAPKEPAKE